MVENSCWRLPNFDEILAIHIHSTIVIFTVFMTIFYTNKIQCVIVSVCQNVIVSQTAGPISAKFGTKAQLNPVGKIAIVSYPHTGGRGGLIGGVFLQ